MKCLHHRHYDGCRYPTCSCSIDFHSMILPSILGRNWKDLPSIFDVAQNTATTIFVHIKIVAAVFCATSTLQQWRKCECVHCQPSHYTFQWFFLVLPRNNFYRLLQTQPLPLLPLNTFVYRSTNTTISTTSRSCNVSKVSNLLEILPPTAFHFLLHHA